MKLTRAPGRVLMLRVSAARWLSAWPFAGFRARLESGFGHRMQPGRPDEVAEALSTARSAVIGTSLQAGGNRQVPGARLALGRSGHLGSGAALRGYE
jgi:hypothetical protein